MKTTAIISLGIVLSAAAMAQMDAPKPGPEQKKLDLFAGSWTVDGDLKATAMGPGGKISEDEKCEWMDGNFFLMCHADVKSTMGNVSGVGVMGYSSDDKAMKGKFTMKFSSPNSYNFTYEMSPDGTKWTSVMDGKATKK